MEILFACKRWENACLWAPKNIVLLICLNHICDELQSRFEWYAGKIMMISLLCCMSIIIFTRSSFSLYEPTLSLSCFSFVTRYYIVFPIAIKSNKFSSRFIHDSNKMLWFPTLNLVQSQLFGCYDSYFCDKKNNLSQQFTLLSNWRNRKLNQFISLTLIKIEYIPIVHILKIPIEHHRKAYLFLILFP